MKTLNKYFFYGIIVSATIFSCIKKVEIDIPYAGDKLVLFSGVLLDSPVYATLSRSARVRPQNGFQKINNGAVLLFENGIKVDSLTTTNIYGQDFYKSNYKAKAGKIYTVSADVIGLSSVHGTDTMVAKSTYSIDSFYSSSTNNSDQKTIRLTINDPQPENFYVIELYAADSTLSPIGPRYIANRRSREYFSINAVGVSSSDIFSVIDGYDYDRFIFADEKFNGRALSVRIKYDNFNSNDHIAVNVKTISKSYYRYLLSAEIQDANDGNPFTEPTKIFSNIKNGYGIVGMITDNVIIR